MRHAEITIAPIGSITTACVFRSPSRALDAAKRTLIRFSTSLDTTNQSTGEHDNPSEHIVAIVDRERGDARMVASIAEEEQQRFRSCKRIDSDRSMVRGGTSYRWREPWRRSKPPSCRCPAVLPWTNCCFHSESI